MKSRVLLSRLALWTPLDHRSLLCACVCSRARAHVCVRNFWEQRYWAMAMSSIVVEGFLFCFWFFFKAAPTSISVLEMVGMGRKHDCQSLHREQKQRTEWLRQDIKHKKIVKVHQTYFKVCSEFTSRGKIKLLFMGSLRT